MVMKPMLIVVALVRFVTTAQDVSTTAIAIPVFALPPRPTSPGSAAHASTTLNALMMARRDALRVNAWASSHSVANAAMPRNALADFAPPMMGYAVIFPAKVFAQLVETMALAAPFPRAPTLKTNAALR